MVTGLVRGHVYSTRASPQFPVVQLLHKLAPSLATEAKALPCSAIGFWV